jgi:hypothetical protein
MKYLMCIACQHAWNAPSWQSCPQCGDSPVDCNPWGSDGRAWYRERTALRIHEIVSLAHYSGNKAHRRALLKGIRAKGNTSVRVA